MGFAVNGFHLPPGIDTCSKSDPEFVECMRSNVENAIAALSGGEKHLGVVPYEPLHIGMISVDENPNAMVRVSQKFYNIKIHGLSLSKVLRFSFNFDLCDVYLETLTPLVRSEAEYELKGHLLIFPIHSKGISNVTSTNVYITHNITCEIYKKRGKEHIHLSEYKISMQPETIHYNFANLFEENHRLSEQVHRTINNNSFSIFEEVKPTTEETYGFIFKEISNRIFNRIPLEDIVSD
ncbi:hypothetical protein FQA39_LY16643 [Lamprigera yunnana]|nr:hypothetical protein FQA39_LY16643 [Lamprigera yunnana]